MKVVNHIVMDELPLCGNKSFVAIANSENTCRICAARVSALLETLAELTLLAENEQGDTSRLRTVAKQARSLLTKLGYE